MTTKDSITPEVTEVVASWIGLGESTRAEKLAEVSDGAQVSGAGVAFRVPA